MSSHIRHKVNKPYKNTDCSRIRPYLQFKISRAYGMSVGQLYVELGSVVEVADMFILNPITVLDLLQQFQPHGVNPVHCICFVFVIEASTPLERFN